MANDEKQKEIKIEGEPEEAEEPVRPTPDVEANFTALLQDYGIGEKAAVVITKHIADTGSGRVFEKPMEMLEKLAKFPRQIPPVTRRNILDHWVAQNKIPVPEGYEEQAEMPAEELRHKRGGEGKLEAKYSVDTETGAIRVATTTDKTALTWDEAQKLSETIEKKLAQKLKRDESKGGMKVAYVFDTERGQVRMAKEDEVGGTLEQAKELKKMAAEGKGEGEESPFIQDEEGNWSLNPRARVTGVELMALENIRKAHERGEPVDPLEAITQAANKMKGFQEALGGGGRELPAWMTDPAKFIETIRTISPEPKADQGLKEELADLKKALDDMKEARHKEELANIQVQMTAQARQHEQKMNDILEKMEELKKPITGRTEMDIIDKLATGVLEEAKGLRTDVRSMVTSQALPPLKSPLEREQRKGRYKQALEIDQTIDELGRQLFFGEK